MRQTLRPGQEIDVLTQGELRDALADWVKQTIIGARPVRFSAQAAIDAAGNLLIGGAASAASAASGRTGPNPGFLWIVRRVAITGPTPAVDPTSIYVGDPNSAEGLVYPNLTGVAGATGYKAFNSGELVLQGDDHIVVASTAALVATGTCRLFGAALEFPVALAWKYLS